MKPNQYLRAIKNVNSEFGQWNDQLVSHYPPSRAESLSTSIGDSSWRSTQATIYADEIRSIVEGITDIWTSAHTEISTKRGAESHKIMVDEDGDEGWKAFFLEME